jgi:hypothetical protein
MNQHSAKNSRNRQKERKETIQREREVKSLLFTNDRIPYRGKPKDFTKRLLEPMNKLNKTNKITQKSVAFLCTNDKYVEKEIMKATSFIIAKKET